MNKALAAATITALAVSLIAVASVFLQDSQQEAAATEESFNYTVRFCSMEDCLHALASELKSAKKSVSCALYSIDNSLLSGLSSFYDSNPAEITAAMVFDGKAKAAATNLSHVKIYAAKSKGIMHNKYCTIDSARIITGSFNPTAAAKKDYNNVLMINSTALASFYGSDFEKLKPGNAARTPTAAAVASSKPRPKAAILNTTPVEVYFCPKDGCAEVVMEELRKAASSITFAAYAFTHPEIANELVLKASEGVAVAGVIEKSTTGSKYSKHHVLAANGINVTLESSKKLMHHKFFVVDNKTVITGSFNPTQNAAYRNDENIIIVENAALAQKYLEEFGRITGN